MASANHPLRLTLRAALRHGMAPDADELPVSAVIQARRRAQR